MTSGSARRRIALDAMGGDHAPRGAVAGALRAWSAGLDVVLVGRARALEAELRAAGAVGALEVVGAPDVVGMAEDPAVALRAKPRSSVRVAARLVAAGRADAVVSAGSTGATLAAALLELGRLPQVRRPAVAAVVPAVNRSRGDGPAPDVVLVDAGASAEAQPDTLVGHARMGLAYARARGVEAPRLGLLNVGAEPGKGNALARVAFGLLSGVHGFLGNVEPAVVLAGGVDVVVTDGFTGNVFLKAVEAMGTPRRGRQLAAGVLLGVPGEVLVAHGAADEAEILGALRHADQVVAAGLSRLVAAHLSALGSPP